MAERYAEMYCRGIASALGVETSALVIPDGMSKPEFVAEHERRVRIDGEALWDAEGFIDPDCLQVGVPLCVCGKTLEQHRTQWPACRGFVAAE